MSRAQATMVGVAMLVSGCDRGTSGMDGRVDLVSEGVVIVENEAPTWSAGEEWTVSRDPLFRIGVADGAEAYLFTEVVGFVGTADGGVAVLDARPMNLRFFDATGSHRRTVGGRGQGPGEFGFAEMLLTFADSLLVWDPALSRGTVFSSEGDYARDFSFAEYRGEYGPVRPIGYSVDGTLLLVSEPREGQSRGDVEPDWSTARLVRMSGGTEPAAQIAALPWTQCDRTSASPDPCSFLDFGFGSRAYVALWRDRLVYARSDLNEFRVMDLQGLVTSVIRGPAGRLETTDAMRRDYIESLPSYAPRGRQMTVGDWPFAETLPAFSAFHMDPSGHLWAREYRTDEFLPGATALSSEPVAVEWTVYAPDGVLLGNVPMPANHWVSEIGNDYVLTVGAGEFGVLQLSKYSLEKP